MSSTTLLRLASRSPLACLSRTRLFSPRPHADLPATLICTSRSSNFTTSVPRAAGGAGHHEETFEEFTARYEKEFDSVQDVFDLQRNLNNAFAYDLVPSPSVITAALRAARRVNDFPTAVRIFEAIKAKVENKGQYDEYLRDLQPLREELGVDLQEDLYPVPIFTPKIYSH